MPLEASRSVKKQVLELLMEEDFQPVLEKILSFPPHKALNALISALCSIDELSKWRAVSAIGRIVAIIAEEDMERARVVMRRFMWMLNDESGGIGWGVPEAMAEVMACHEGLGKEYASILVSYLREDANFLEYEPLQRGLLWGIGRLGSVKADLLLSANVEEYLPVYLRSPNPEVRGLAAWAAGVLELQSAIKVLERISSESGDESVRLYWDGGIETISLRAVAKEALSRIKRA